MSLPELMHTVEISYKGASLNLPVFLEDSICLCLPGTILVIKDLHVTDLAFSILELAEPI